MAIERYLPELAPVIMIVLPRTSPRTSYSIHYHIVNEKIVTTMGGQIEQITNIKDSRCC
jgi:hypothetical protein